MKIIKNRTQIKKKFINKLEKFVQQNFPDIYRNIEVVFVSDGTMRKYNKDFAGKNGTTDVLSFDLDDTFVVIVSVDTAKKNAIFYGERFYDELARYVIHGILHLVGYDHKITSNTGKTMKDKEEELLKVWKTYYFS